MCRCIATGSRVSDTSAAEVCSQDCMVRLQKAGRLVGYDIDRTLRTMWFAMCVDYKVSCRRTLAIMTTTLAVFISSRAGPSSAILRSMWSKCCCTAPGCQPECAARASVRARLNCSRSAVCAAMRSVSCCSCRRSSAIRNLEACFTRRSSKVSVDFRSSDGHCSQNS